MVDDIAEHEHGDQDIQWNRIAELELVPHPANVQHPDTIEAEYGMSFGVLVLQVRAAVIPPFSMGMDSIGQRNT